MSKTIDQKVVEMQFDNKNFEKNVSKTMTTLDKLKNLLNFKKETKSLDELQRQADSIKFHGLANTVENLADKFTGLQTIGTVAMMRIANAAVDAGKNITKALTITPIVTGFSEYETKINAIQTIMSNTRSKGTTMDEVTKTLNELNLYADKTIYNFAEMTRNIGTFTAAGVGLKDAAAAIQGIANLAAASGSSSQQASVAMYQLSQALAAGSVKLMDWNSVVNAGMGGQLFQEALKQTAREYGVSIDDIIKKNGSFRNSLQEGWLSADILNTTLKKFTVEGAKEYTESMIASGKYTKEQADALLKEAQSMEDAATKVKTFTQLWSTLQESAQSGWAQTWEIIIGNFDEAKELLTKVSDVIGGILNESANARNEVLQGWKDLGGRSELIKAFENMFDAITNIIKPIHDAFRDIFPRKTSEELLSLTKKFEQFTSKLIIGEKTAEKLKNTFSGLFSVIKTAITIVKTFVNAGLDLLELFLPLGDAVLTVTSSFGKWLEKTTKAVRDSNTIANILNKLVDVIKNVTEKINQFISDTLKFDNVMNFFSGMFNFISKIGLAIGKFFGSIIRNGDLKNVVDILNGGLFGGLILATTKFVKRLENIGGSIESVTNGIKDCLSGVKDILKAYQEEIQSKTLLNIAKAVGILAASLLVLSLIPSEKIVSSLGAMAGVMIEFMAMFKIWTLMAKDVTKAARSSIAMIGMATSLLILATAMKKLDDMNLEQVGSGLIAMAGGMAILITGLQSMPDDTKIVRNSIGLIAMATAMNILASALKSMGNLSILEIGKSLLTLGASLKILTSALNKIPDGSISKGTGLLIMASSLIILGTALTKLSGLSWSDIARSLTAMGGALLILTIAINKMPGKQESGKASKSSFSMIGMATSIVILGYALEKLSKLSWSDIARSLTAMGGALVLLVSSMAIISKTKSSSKSIVAASAALVVFAMGMKMLSSISWTGLLKSMAGLAIGITGLVIAAKLLTPIVPTLLAVAGAAALFGVASVAFGAGLVLIASGITALSLALSGGATMIVAGLSAIILGILGLVPEIVNMAKIFAVGLLDAIIEIAPLIAKAIFTTIYQALKIMADYIPMIVDVIMDLIINTLRAISDRLPELIVSVAELLKSFFKGVIEAIDILDPKSLMSGIKAIGMLTGIMLMLAALAHLVPSAMIGVLAFGALALELSLVVGLLGKVLSGKEASLEQAGNSLMVLGSAIGKFIGGLVGGFASGVTSNMPDIANNLSKFMVNLQPFLTLSSGIDSSILGKITLLSGAILILTAANFITGLTNLLTLGQTLPKLGTQLGQFMINADPFIKGANLLSPSILTGVNALASSIIALTGANVLNGISSFILGGNNLTTFGKDIVGLGTSMQQFSKNLGNFNSSNVKSIEAACDAITSLAKASKNIPREGGVWGWLAGENSIGKFSSYLPSLGTNLNTFVRNLGNFTDAQVQTVSCVGKAVSELAKASKDIPNEGGVWGWLAGDNSIGKFSDQLPSVASALKSFVDNLGTFTEEQVSTASYAAKCIAEMAKAANDIPNSGGLVSLFTGDNDILPFASKLPTVGSALKGFINNLGSFNNDQTKAASYAAKCIAEMTKASSDIPNSGGLVTLFTGDNDILPFASKLPTVGSALSGFVQNLGIFTEAQVTTADCAGRAIAALAKSASQIPSEGSPFDKLFGSKSLAEFSSKLPTLATNLKSFVDNLGTFTEDQVLSADCASRAIKALGDAASNIPAEDGLWQKIVGEKSIAAFGDKLPGLGTNLSSFVNNLGTFTEDQVSSTDCAAKAIAAFAKAGQDIPNSGGLVSLFTGDNDIKDFAEKLPTVGTALGNFIRNIGTFGQTQIDTVNASTEAMKALTKFDDVNIESVNKVLTDVGDNLGNFGSKLSKFASGVSSVSSETITDAVNKMNSVINMAKGLSDINMDTLKGFGNTLKTLGTDAVKGFVDSFSGDEPKEKAGRAIRDLIDALITSAETKRKDITDKFDSLANSIINTLNSTTYNNKMKEAGKYFAQGFANGINEHRYLATNAGSALGNAAYNAAKKAIDAHSPSKKSFKLGNFFGQGFVNGISEYSNKIYDTSYSIGDKAKSGMQKAISTINNILDNNMDTNPTIKPVLDLSNIKNNINGINDMFKTQTISSNINAITFGMNQRNQNGANDDVVNAINKLGSTINGNGDTYNINGISYGSDSEIAEAVRMLIRAANIERRT